MTTDTLPCTHPAGCLRDGACGWCAEVARLHAFGDEWYAAAQGYERRLGCGRSPWASDEPTPLEAERAALAVELHRDHERLAEMGETLLRVVAERAALAAYAERLRVALENLLTATQEPPAGTSVSWDWRQMTATMRMEAEAALVATPEAAP